MGESAASALGTIPIAVRLINNTSADVQTLFIMYPTSDGGLLNQTVFFMAHVPRNDVGFVVGNMVIHLANGVNGFIAHSFALSGQVCQKTY
jgi:hypothetical protein